MFDGSLAVCLFSSIYLEEGIPRAGTDRHPVFRHTVVMTNQNTCSLRSNVVSDVAVEVIVSGQEEFWIWKKGTEGEGANYVVV